MSDKAGWLFTNTRAHPIDYGGNILLYGLITNDTGVSQRIEAIKGIFYDGQGQIIADEESTFDYRATDLIPPDGRLPFELTVLDAQDFARFNLGAKVEPSTVRPRQDFEFSDVIQTSEAGAYCLEGKLQNPGGELEDYLVIMAVLYDGQDNVIKFDKHDVPSPKDVVGGRTLEFKLCVDPLGQEVARHELQAWGL